VTIINAVLIALFIGVLFSNLPKSVRGVIAGLLAIIILAVFALRQNSEYERREP
jgi:hypothetical protein